MKDKIDPKEWANDFETFMSSDGVQPPIYVTNKILGFVHTKLNPNVWSIIAKFSGIHAVIGSLSLLLCSQFGMGSGSMLFMSFGKIGCMALCGSLFLGLSMSLAGFIFSLEELRKMRRTGYSPILVVGMLSLAVFLAFGAEMVFGLAVAWIIGAFIAGALVTELTLGLRRLALHA